MRRLAAVAACLALALAACGGDDDSGGAAQEGPTTVKVGVLPISALAPLYLGIEKGFFADERLRIEPQVAQAGSALVPSVLSGEAQFAFGNVVSVLIAGDKGLPIRIIAQGAQAGPGPSSRYEAVITSKRSGIRKPADLAGKTVAVNALDNIGGLMISGALEKLGVDSGRVRYTEIPFPEVNAAVDAGRVDAAYQTEPFLTQARRDGHRVVLEQYPTLAPKVPIAAYFTSERYMQEHPEIVQRFRSAMNRSLQYAAAHEREARAIVPTFTKIPSALARGMVLPSWSTDLDPARSGLQLVTDLAREQGLVKERVDLGRLIAR